MHKRWPRGHRARSWAAEPRPPPQMTLARAASSPSPRASTPPSAPVLSTTPATTGLRSSPPPLPIHASINVEANPGTKSNPVYTPATEHAVFGDASLAASLAAHPFLLDY